MCAGTLGFVLSSILCWNESFSEKLFLDYKLVLLRWWRFGMESRQLCVLLNMFRRKFFRMSYLLHNCIGALVVMDLQWRWAHKKLEWPWCPALNFWGCGNNPASTFNEACKRSVG